MFLFYFGGNIPVFRDKLIMKDKGLEISELILFSKTAVLVLGIVCASLLPIFTKNSLNLCAISVVSVTHNPFI